MSDEKKRSQNNNRNTRYRSVCFTLNNPTEEERKSLIDSFDDHWTYLVIGDEKGDSGTPHLQCYGKLNKRHSHAALKRLIPRAHFERTRGTPKQAADYCKKDGKFVEFGTLPVQGKRTDMDSFKDALKDPKTTVKQLYEDHFSNMLRYGRAALEARNHMLANPSDQKRHDLMDYAMDPIRDWSTSHILHGKPGIGKTCYALAHFECPLLVSHMDDLLQFDRNKHDGIIFDDMDFQHMPRSAQIHIVDVDFDRSIHCRYRAAAIPRNTKKIFTTNQAYGTIFNLNDQAILRRLTITECTEENLRLPVYGPHLLNESNNN
jgi:hypothetical protein